MGTIEAEPVASFDAQHHTILIVDDEPANLAVVAEYLVGHGFQIEIAQTGETGLELARLAPPDLILLDVRLPGIDGFETCRRLKADERTREIPILFMTVVVKTEDKVKGFGVGGVDYITKPFQREEVLARVVAHLRIRDLTHELQRAKGTLENRVEDRTAELAQANKDLHLEIAERYRAEEALAQSASKLRSTLQAMDDLVFVLDRETRFIDYYAPGEALYTSPETFIGKKYSDVMPPAMDEPFTKAFNENRKGHAAEFEYQLEIGGEIKWYAAKLSPMLLEDEFAGSVAVIRDITERKHAEQEREKLIAELEAKNAELERFVYTVSHDLKSPLVTIRGFLGYVEQDALAGNVEQMKGDMARIVNAADKMQQLLGDLLELSRIGRLMNPPEDIPLGELARDAVSTVAGRLTGRGVRVDIAPDLPVVHGDRIRLREVIENLLDNAVKYMGEQPHPRIEIGVRGNEGERVFFVRDNGLGIDPRYHQKVFGLFEKLDPKAEGTGVGLAIVKRIIDVHGGRIWVESEGEGKGSTFCFTLPPAGQQDINE